MVAFKEGIDVNGKLLLVLRGEPVRLTNGVWEESANASQRRGVQF